jgi:hypothetical protein
MIVMRRWNVLLPTAAVVLATFTLTTNPSAAQVVKPFKIKGSGEGPTGLPLPGQDPREHWIVGEATHLGRHHGEGTVRTDSADIDLPDGVITGRFGSGSPFIFTGANGDQLACDYGDQPEGEGEGTFTLTILDVLGFLDGQPILLVQAKWIADFVVKPEMSTGKFAGVTGSWKMIARSEPFVLGSFDPAKYSWEGEGQLTFPRGQ